MYLINLLAAPMCASCRFKMSDGSPLMAGEGQKQWNKHTSFALKIIPSTRDGEELVKVQKTLRAGW